MLAIDIIGFVLDVVRVSGMLFTLLFTVVFDPLNVANKRVESKNIHDRFAAWIYMWYDGCDSSIWFYYSEMLGDNILSHVMRSPVGNIGINIIDSKTCILIHNTNKYIYKNALGDFAQENFVNLVAKNSR